MRRDKRDATLSSSSPTKAGSPASSDIDTHTRDTSNAVGDLIKRIGQRDVDTPDATMASSSAFSPGSTLLRDPELWFDDGNLVLIAGGVQFCVYKGLLTSQSAVFKDMLSLPQPASDDASLQDDSTSLIRATVHLSDSPEDLRHFLRAFTSGSLRYASNDAFHLNCR